MRASPDTRSRSSTLSVLPLLRRPSSMSALICGSLAFDTITTFPGRFAQQILPEQVHILNVWFIVPTLRSEFGGCEGNNAFMVSLSGGQSGKPPVGGSYGREDLFGLDSYGG